MTRSMITRMSLGCLMLLATGLSGSAFAQSSSSEVSGPNGTTINHTVRHGRYSVSNSYHTGPLGLHGCRTIRRSFHSGHGVYRSAVRRCH